METPEDRGTAVPQLPAQAGPDKDARNWAMVAHLSGFAYYLTGIGHILGPLIVWLLKKESHPFIDVNGKEALNFQISMTIYGIVSVVLIFTVVGALIGIPLLIGIHVLQIVGMIIAAIKAADGVAWRYPLTIRFV
jgi:uncharacterized protein